jgi:alpha-L-fucosidase
VTSSRASYLTNPNPPPSKTFQNNWLARVGEVVDNYHPDLLYFRGRMGVIGEQCRKDMFACYYNVSDSIGQDVGVFYTYDRLEATLGLLNREVELKNSDFLVERSLDSRSHGYVYNAKYLSPDALIADLVDTVSKGNVYLLNIAPRADGVIPDAVCARLRTVGDWLSVNGEAIYGTRPWEIFGEVPYKNAHSNDVQKGQLGSVYNPSGQNIRFARSKDGRFLYATFLVWPGETALIASLNMENTKNAKEIATIAMLGSDQSLAWSRGEDGLTVQMPEANPSEYAIVLKIEWK